MWGRVSSGERNQGRLKERRRLRRGIIAFSILLCILLGAVGYGLWQSEVRISRVDVIGSSTDAQETIVDIATRMMRGSYFGIIPRDSIFFFPEDYIRTSILASHSNIAAVSISRNKFTGLSIKVDMRVPIARWCGLAPTEGVEEYCYVFDASGVIYAASSSTTSPLNPFKLYAPLADDTAEPLRASIMSAEKIPTIFDFARNLTMFGSSVVTVVIHNGEVDNNLASGTRITYVLGNEQSAFTALVSARDNFNLSDGSIDYLDLRFNGKVYLKRK